MKNLKLLMIPIVTFSALTGCLNSAYKARVVTAPERLTCPTKTQSSQNTHITAFEAQNKKIFIEDFYHQIKESPSKIQLVNSSQALTTWHALSSSDVLLKKDSEISVLIDRACLRDRSHDMPITAHMKNSLLKTTRDDITPHEAHIFRPNEDMLLSQFEHLADMDECILGASPRIELKPLGVPNDTLYDQLGNMKTIFHEEIYDKLKVNDHRRKIHVTVIDSGTDFTHPDLRDTHWENPDELNGQPGVDDDGNGFIDDVRGWDFMYGTNDPTGKYQIPHGEHVAGVIGATANNSEGISGIASNRVAIMHINVIPNPIFPPNPGPGVRDIDLVDRALRYAADFNTEVINISMGARGTSAVMREALIYAVNKGAFIAVAAANYAEEVSPETPWYPAIYGAEIEGMITVAATDGAFGGNRRLCDFSNFSTTYVELAAPGCDYSNQNEGYTRFGILSTVREANGRPGLYGYMAGTSMASPHVAGAAAALVAYYWDNLLRAPSPADVERLLKEGSDTLTILDGKVTDSKHLNLKTLFEYVERTEFEHEPNPTPCP